MADPDPLRSGLRDPERAARSLAALAMSFEAVALLLAIVPMNILLDDATVAVTVILALTAACVVLAAMAKHPWVWPAGVLVQAGLIACWSIHWSLTAAGLVFGLVWIYCWHVSARLRKPPRR